MANYGKRRNSGSRVGRTARGRRLGAGEDFVRAAARAGYHGVKRARAGYQRAMGTGSRRNFGPVLPKNTTVRSRNPYTADTKLQYTKKAVKYGKKVPKMALLKKLDVRNTYYDVLRFGGCNRQTDQKGYFTLAHKNLTAASDNDIPIHLLEVDLRTHGEGAGTGSIFSPLSQIAHNSTSGQCSWSEIKGVANAGASLNSVMQTVKSTALSAATSQASRSQASVLEWVNVKFLFRTPNIRAGWIRVQLVQFKEEDCIPGPNAAWVSTKAGAFYGRLADQGGMYNTISAQPSGTRMLSEYCKVLKTWVVNYQPGDANDLDTNNNQKRLDIFLRLNRYCNYRKPTSDLIANGFLDDDAYVTDVDNISTDILCNPGKNGARLFLLIHASTCDPVETVAVDPNRHVTYDMEMRTKHIFRSMTG